MAIARDNAADLGFQATSTYSANFTVGSGTDRIVFFTFGWAAAEDDDVVSVTAGGVAMTQVGKNLNGDKRYLYRLINPASGSIALAVTTTNAHTTFAGAASYDGAHQSSQPTVATTNQTAGAATSLLTSHTPAAADSWIILTEGSYNGNPPPDAGTGATKIEDDGTFGTWGLFDTNTAVPASSYSMTTTRTSITDRPINHIMIDITPAGGAAGLSPNLRMGLLGIY